MLAEAQPQVIYFGTMAQRHEQSRGALRAMLEASSAQRYLDLNVREGQVTERIAHESLKLADIVKVNESVQRAQTSVALQSAGAHSRIGSAADSLQRIKQRQAVQEERLRVGQEFEDKRTGADLDAKLKEAGILPGHSSADDVLARLSAPKEVQVVTPLIQQGETVYRDKA